MPWIQLQIPADPDNADQLEDLLMEMGADAVSMEDAADQPIFEPDPGTTPLWSDTRVTGLFDAERDIDRLCADVRDAWHLWRPDHPLSSQHASTRAASDDAYDLASVCSNYRLRVAV